MSDNTQRVKGRKGEHRGQDEFLTQKGREEKEENNMEDF